MLPDGSFFNAYTSIADSFKFIEEALQISNANSGRPETVGGSGRAGTALSGASKTGRGENNTSVSQLTGPMNSFTLGVNCDGESVFNKDPKDPNKYEIEGVKV